MKEIKAFLRHLYGAGILFFYYLKWPVAIGVPVLYLYLHYPRNIFMDLLWLYCVILIIKDFVVMFLRYKRGEKIWR
ncbi:hypothetical protein [Nitratiruptor sp. YY09-18]|uniref:hypothetical protein n=1 Tax=Nitratiruptor sp. YY09-18 TaxID=2724901 RepID=UPI001915F051|nr:hypothetical protein [Nitratiruptor sp. YY09-18]BCD68889.1 hypothetical protein NitYY0918_C1808 [Nitratiruptor sp. YY09-18]